MLTGGGEEVSEEVRLEGKMEFEASINHRVARGRCLGHAREWESTMRGPTWARSSQGRTIVCCLHFSHMEITVSSTKKCALFRFLESEAFKVSVLFTNL